MVRWSRRWNSSHWEWRHERLAGVFQELRRRCFQGRRHHLYKPEDIVLGEYAFLPWVRTGLAAAIQSPAGADLRGVVVVTADLVASDGSQPAAPVEKTLILRGPGDVVGIDPSQIIRREPNANIVNAEETFLAHIEFDRPELPWLFSPFAPTGDTLQPWLALVVCKADKVVLLPSAPGRPIQLATTLGELQPLSDAASWAHAQVIGRTTAKTPLADRLSDDHAPANLSRILCPRKLEPQTDYIACLVPAFDCGARTGLGQSGGTLELAWKRAPDNSDAATQIILPVYDSWTFSTAPAGDFKTLAEKLEGIAAPWTIGRRIVDTSRPEGGFRPWRPVRKALFKYSNAPWSHHSHHPPMARPRPAPGARHDVMTCA